ncbi:MAG: UbiA family prenyltransferase, partial [Fibrobacterota bacterium]
IWAAFLSGLSLVIPLILSFPLTALLSLFSLIIGGLYCFHPFYFTGRPLVDFISNALGYGAVAFAAGYAAAGGDIFTLAAVRAMTPYVLFMAAGSISSTLPDYEGDRAHNKRTTAVVFGRRRAHVLALMLVTGALAAALGIGDTQAVCISVAALPLYILYALIPKAIFMESIYKAGGAFAMLCIGWYYPILPAAGIVIAGATKLFFRMVYNVSYPSLLPAEDSSSDSE